MNKTALQDIQKTLNIIRNQIDAVDTATKWAALELILASSVSVVALAKKMTKPDTKTVTRTVAVPKTKIVKQEPQQQLTPKDTERTDFTPVRPQPPLPNQQGNRDKRWKPLKSAQFIAVYNFFWRYQWQA
jgi:hypothetical protein